jgi:hypothetical protein
MWDNRVIEQQHQNLLFVAPPSKIMPLHADADRYRYVYIPERCRSTRTTTATSVD